MANRTISSNAPIAYHGWYRSNKTIGGSFAIVTGDLTTGNTVTLFTAPKGFTVTDIRIDATKLDTNATPTVTLSVGDAGSATRFLNASTIAQAGGTVIGNISTTNVTLSPGQLFRFTADTPILATFATGAATAQAGTLLVRIEGYLDN